MTVSLGLERLRAILLKRGTPWLWATVASVAPYVVGLVSVVALTKLMLPSDYGTWSVIGSTVGLLISLSGLGVEVISVARLAVANESAARHFGAALAVLVGAGSLTTVVLIAFAPVLTTILVADPSAAWLFALAAAVVPFAPFPRMVAVRARALQAFKTFAVVTAAEQAVIAIALVLGAVLAGLAGVVGAYAFARVTFSTAIGSICVRSAQVPTFREVRDLLRAALPLAPLPVLSWVLNLSDRWIVSAFAGTDAVALYAAGYAVGSLELLLFAPAALVFLPRFVGHWREDIPGALAYARRMILLLLAAGLVASLALAVAAGDLLAILTTPYYRAAADIAAVVAFASMFLGLTTVPANMLIAQERNGTLTVLYSGAALLNIALTLLLVAVFGSIGAAWSSLLSYASLLFAQTAASLARTTGP